MKGNVELFCGLGEKRRRLAADFPQGAPPSAGVAAGVNSPRNVNENEVGGSRPSEKTDLVAQRPPASPVAF